MNAKLLKLLMFAGACIVLGALTADTHAQESWTSKAPIPLARNEVALAAVGRKSPRDRRRGQGCGGYVS